MDIKDLIIYRRTIPARKAIYSSFPESLNPKIVEFLRERGIDQLYCHQAQMYELAREGKNVVITTSTASGKTLSFLLPVIQEILEHPTARAIFIYPTKALAADQYRALQPWLSFFGPEKISAGVYDGDTPVNERKRIRDRANIILTNPEMLNGAMLPNHSKYGFDFIFSNLKYVVLDEMHTYRGAFGSHMANVFRRLSRITEYYHAVPHFLCSSATIANPVELAEKICGQPFASVKKDGSAASERNYLLIQPPKISGKDQQYYGQESIVSVAAQMLPQLMEQRESFLAFAKSRKNVEVVLKETRDRLDAADFLTSVTSDQISGYRGGYTPIERKTIEQQMIRGDLLGLVSTNALELGIDIGSIGVTVLIGYPGTRSSFWQQTGRAGRSKKSCTNYLILDHLPMDHYIGLEPGWLFDESSEHAVIDPDNLLIELAHIRAAAAELPLSLDDIARFPDLGETIPVLMKMQEVRSQNGRFAWAGGEYPAGDFSMRNIDKNKYTLLNQETGKTITEMDESQAFREIHEGAVYIHDGESYRVVKMNLESKMAYAIPFNGNYYTVAGGETNIHVIHSQKEQQWNRIRVQFGDVNVADYVYMYKKLQFHNHQNLGYEELRTPLTKDYDTEGTWMHLPENLVRAYRGLLQVDDTGRLTRNNHFQGLCFALKNAAQMVTMTEQEDIHVITSTNALELSGETASDVSIYFYDGYVGGLGFSEKIYDLIPQVIEQAIRMVSGCKCKDGCAACVGDYKLDRKLILWGLENLREASEVPKGEKVVTWAESTWKRKEFRLETLPEKWDIFCRKARENREQYAGFFQTVHRVKVKDTRLILSVDTPFFAQWANGPENKQSLRNLIGYYTELPAGFRLEIRAERPEKRGNLSDITGSDTRKTWTESHDTAGRSVEDYDREEREKQEKILRRYRAMDIRREKKDDGSE